MFTVYRYKALPLVNVLLPVAHDIKWIFGQWRPRSTCASTQSDQNLCYPRTESLDTTECISEMQMPWLWGYKTFFMLYSAQHELFNAYKYQITIANSFLLNITEYENFSANKYENANCWHWVAFSYLLAEKISCSAELSMKEVL